LAYLYGKMPIQVKTMRDLWDVEEKEKESIEESDRSLNPTGKYKAFPPEIAKHYLEYLAKKKAFLDVKEEIAKIFADYEKRLGDAGFSKIHSVKK